AEQLEELLLRLGQEADQPRHHLAVSRIAVEVVAGVKGDLLSVFVLQRPADELRDENLVLQRPDLQADLLIENAIHVSGDFRDHFASLARSASKGCPLLARAG